jgi:sporulation protein YlmC with PRC-barrel domain
MRLSTIALSFLALVISAGVALARVGTTNTELGLREGPSPNTELLLTMPAGAKVSVGACSRSWCKVNWNGYSGYAVKSGLAISAAPPVSARTAYPPPGEIVPIYPPYPYRSGYYPKADWYFDIPPYTAIEPSFYRRRYFMMSQERNRYRYMPHIFSGGLYGGGGPIEGIDMGRISSGLRKDLSTTPTLTTPTSTPPLSTPTPTPTTPSPISPKSPSKTEPSPPSPQAPVSPPSAAPVPSPQAPEVSPPPAAPGPSPQAPEVSPPSAAPGPSPQAPEVSPPPAAPGPSPQAPEGPLGVTVSELHDVTKGWSVKRTILNQPVYNEKDERVGSVDDIIVTPDKALSDAIINAGGFLGLTKHNVSIPVSQFKLVDNKLVLPGATKEALKASPEFRDVTKGWSIERTLLGQPVYNEMNERVGSVDDIIVTPDKALSYGIINAGGFLGLTKHNVAIPVSQFKLVDNRLVLPGATKKALKASPEFQYAQ